MMRVITGSAKGVKLGTLEGLNTRPTSERTKEALFSMLQFDIEGRTVLDLYAGTGQLGIEALSRGAARAVFVDNSKDASNIIKKNLVKTRLEMNGSVVCRDAADFLRFDSVKYDIVFIDPPYALHVVPDMLELLIQNELLKPSSFVVCESEEEDLFAAHESLKTFFEIVKNAKYGIAHITVLKKRTERTEDNL